MRHFLSLVSWHKLLDFNYPSFAKAFKYSSFFVEFVFSLSKSNHQNYLRQVGDRYELVRPIGCPAKKYDILNFKRYEYSVASVLEISDQIKDKLNFSLISQDIRAKYPKGHPCWERHLFGYCVPATFSLLFFMDTDRLHPFRGLDPNGEKHWWLQDQVTGDRFDITSSQYDEKELAFVYSNGIPKKMYSSNGKPQSRFMDLMQLVQPKTNRFLVTVD